MLIVFLDVFRLHPFDPKLIQIIHSRLENAVQVSWRSLSHIQFVAIRRSSIGVQVLFLVILLLFQSFFDDFLIIFFQAFII